MQEKRMREERELEEKKKKQREKVTTKSTSGLETPLIIFTGRAFRGKKGN